MSSPSIRIAVNPSDRVSHCEMMLEFLQSIVTQLENDMDSLNALNDDSGFARAQIANLRIQLNFRRAAIGFWRGEQSFWKNELNEIKTALKESNKLAGLS